MNQVGYRILVVDDDPDILRVVALTLEDAGYAVATALGADAALREIATNGLPHLAVVDIMMPGIDGIELCREIQKSCDLPVIMLSAANQEEVIVRTLRQVADDYVVKPFRPQELVARVERVLRRVGDFAYALAPLIRIDDTVSIDFARQSIHLDEEVVSLTPTENKILHILVRNAGRTVTSDSLLRRIWPLEEIFEDTLRVHIFRLRQKLEPDPGKPRYIQTRRQTGYSFLAPA